MPDVLCIGETMALIAPDPPRPLAEAATLVLGAGGAESNVAAWLARLGADAHWCGRVGDDPLGRRVLAELAAAGVGLSRATIDTHAPTGVFFKDPSPTATRVWYYRRGSAGSRLDADDVERALALRPRVLHLSGITPALSDSAAAAIEHAFTRAATLGIAVSFDVNHRPALWPPGPAAAGVLRDLAARADITFVGRDEAATLWSTADPADIRAHLGDHGTLVVKDGAGPATCFGSDGVVSVPAPPVEVVEPVGAGDAFAAGWLYGLLHDLPPEARLRLAHLTAGHALRTAADLCALAVDPARLVAAALAKD